MVTKRRVLIAVLGGLMLLGGIANPSVVEADSFTLPDSPACVTEWRLNAGDVGNWGKFDIGFRLDISHPTGLVHVVSGRWEWSGPPASYRSGMYWKGPGSFVAGGYGIGGPTAIYPTAWNATGRLSFRLWSPFAYGGCFQVSAVRVWRTPAVGPGGGGSEPGIPTPMPGTPSPQPVYPPGATPSLAPGECLIPVPSGQVIEGCESQASLPPSTAPPPAAGAEACPAIPAGYGTFSVSFGPMATGVGCYLWAGLPTGDGTITVAWNSGSEAWRPAGACGSTFGCRGGVAGGVAGGNGSTSSGYPISGSVANCSGAFMDETASATGTHAGSWSAISGSGGWTITSVSGRNKWQLVRNVSRMAQASCGIGQGETGFRGTITVTGTAPLFAPGGGGYSAPTFSPQPGGMVEPSFPASWGSPGPRTGENDDVDGTVEVCDPSSIASGRLVCATVNQSDLEPGALGSPHPADIGSPGPGPEFPSVVAALDDIHGEMMQRAPFAWAEEVVGALDPSGYAGPALDWCMSPFGVEICADPYAVSAPIVSFRPILLGLMLVLLAWAVGRRVWASVGGTSGSDE